MTSTRAVAAAAALVAALPTPRRLEAIAGAVPAEADLSTAVSATFVGSTAADLAIVMVDRTLITDGAGPTVGPADLLRPALEAAASALGTGSLGQPVAGATDLFSDPDSTVFELRGEQGIDGWFAVRVHAAALRSLPPVDIADRIGRIRDVEMVLTVELGRTRMPVRDVLALEPGATVELDRAAGSHADVLLNGRLIAHGEIVVVDQDYAVRITRILDAAETA